MENESSSSGSSPSSVYRVTDLQHILKVLEPPKALTPRLRLRDFVFAAWQWVEGSRSLEWGWHLDAICEHLEALVDGRLSSRNLLVNVPPRTSKSTIVTVMFPCWLWTFKPETQFAFASYSFSLSRDHAYKRRAIIESEWYQENFGDVVQLAGDRNNIAEVANTARGMLYTTSVGGSTTGRGGDYLILDDPNDAEQMESEVQRASTLRWVDINWSTRGNDPKSVRNILIQQRTHVDDVTGHVLKQNPEAWTHLKIPMERGDKSCVTPIWTDPRASKGELLQPARFDAAYIALQRLRLGSYFYAGQYDQEPYPVGGGIFKQAWFERRWSRSKDNLGQILCGSYAFDPMQAFRFIVVDPAITEKTIGEKKTSDPDFTAIFVCAVISTPQGPHLAVMDAVHERLEGPDILPRLQALQDYWHVSVIGVETIAFQLALFQFAQRMGLPVREISTKNDPESLYRIDKDKTARAVSATPFCEQRLVFLPDYAPWVAEFLAEACSFPNGSHDDFVDVLAYAVAIAAKFMGQDFYAQAPGRSYNRNDDRTVEAARDGEAPEGFMAASPYD